VRAPRKRHALLATGAAAAALALLAILFGPESETTALTGIGSDQRPRSALDVPDPQPLGTAKHLSMWTTVRNPATARSQPDPHSRAVAELGRLTPEGTENTVLALARRQDPAGKTWVQVRLAVLPNGTKGWVPRRALGGYRIVHTRLVVDLATSRLTLLRDGRPVLRAPVGVGRPESPTPTGEFYIRNRLARYAGKFYGPLAFGTSARSAVLTDWPDGGFVGIHGTDRPDLIPGHVSHGCIRLRNSDILRLGKLMPVGTPITVSR
jgi:hypothetical protein